MSLIHAFVIAYVVRDMMFYALLQHIQLLSPAES